MGAGHSAKTRRRPYGGNVSGYADSSLSLEVPTRVLPRVQHQDHSDHGLAHSLLRPSCERWFHECRKPRPASSRVPRQGSPPTSFRIEAASPLKRRSKGLSCVRGNLHAQFLEGRIPAMGSGYSVNLFRCDLNSYGDECLVKGADRSSHRTYPTRQSGEVTNCSGTLGQWTPLARVASEPRGNGASASSEAEVGLGCMDSMVSICKLLQAS